MDIYHKSLLTRRVSIPMTQIGGTIQQVLHEALSGMEGKCGEEGYIKRNSIQIFNYSCGLIKGPNVIVQVVFECQISNPVPNQVIECIVEHNTRAGIKARLRAKGDSPFIVFLARDHHYMIPHFSDIKEQDNIKVKILGQRFEINDPKISIIGSLIVEDKVEDKESESESEEELTGGGDDVLVFSYKSADDKPGRGSNEKANPNKYKLLSTKLDWRQKLSPFNTSTFKCNGVHNIQFKDAEWNTLEHFFQASKTFLANPTLADELCVGGKHGESAHNLESILNIHLTPEQLEQWERIKEDVMYTGAKAMLEQHPYKMEILLATRPAHLKHFNKGKLEECTYYEKIRDAVTI
jgi:hypothetical protein